MKKMVVKVVVLVLVLAAVGGVGFIFGSSSADAKSTEVLLKPNKIVYRYDDDYSEVMAVEYIDTDTGVHYFVSLDKKKDHSITFMCPRYDKKGNVMVTKVK